MKGSPRAIIPAVIGCDFVSGVLETAGKRITIFGPSGIGKSTLAAWLPGAAFLDLEHGTTELNVSRDITISDWPTLRGKLAALYASPPQGLRSIIIDTATEAQKLAREHVVANRKAGGGKNEGAARQVESIEDFGWGKGWQFVGEEFDGLLADCDRLVKQRGINVCMIAHAVAADAPNPGGEQYSRWEPHLSKGDKDKRGSIRDAVFTWSDHVLFVNYDVTAKDGVGIGHGSRSVYTLELPTQIAKSRSRPGVYKFTAEDPSSVWRELRILPAK